MTGLLRARLRYWARKHGVLGLVRLSLLRIWRTVFRGSQVMFYVDMSELERKSFALGGEVSVQRCERETDIPKEDLAALAAFKGGEAVLRELLAKFFRRGAVLWIAKLDGEVAGYHWSVRGGFDGFFTFPLAPKDVVLMASEVLPQHRGKGVNPAMIQQMLFALREEGATRAYIGCASWNKANLRSIPKTSFRRLAVARSFRCLGRYVSVWRRDQFKEARVSRGPDS